MYNLSQQMMRQVHSQASHLNQDQLAKEEESQIIGIRGKESRIKANAPQLIKVFETIGLDRQDVRLQVKSMFFNNDFPNIYAKDRIRLYPQAIFVNTLTNDLYRIVAPDYAGKEIWIPLCNQYLLYQQSTGPELADRMTRELDYFIYDNGALMQNQTYYVLSRLLAAIKFSVDSMSGKLEVTLKKTDFNGNDGVPFAIEGIQVSGSGYTTLGNFLLNGINNLEVIEFDLLISTDYEALEKDQTRVAQLLGLPQGSIANPTPGSYGYQFSDVASQSELAYHGQATLLSPLQMNMNWIKYITIRTSSRSNITYQDGHSESILDYVPIQSSVLGSLETYIREQKLYSVSDSIVGVRKIELELLDHYMDPLIFMSDYMLQLAIFYK